MLGWRNGDFHPARRTMESQLIERMQYRYMCRRIIRYTPMVAVVAVHKFFSLRSFFLE